MPKFWEFPGGKLDEGQDISYALEREVLEETGLLISVHQRISYYESRILTVGKYKGLPYVILVGVAFTNSNKVKLSSEHDDFAWVNVDQAMKYKITDETRRSLLSLTAILKKSLSQQ